MNLNYIQINNNNIKNQNYIRMPITPTMVNYKINNLISPINVNNNYNYGISEYNVVKNKNYGKNILDYNYRFNNKIKNLQEYSAVISVTNNNIQEQNSSSNINQLKRKKNISLNKIQNEIKMIEMKLRSDIIKNKIKQLSNISKDNKNKIPYSKSNYMNITNQIYKNNIPKINNFNYFDKNSFIQQRNKERKTYKIRKLKNNDNNDSKNFIFIKNKIDSKDNKINRTAQNTNSSKSIIFDKSSSFINNNNYKLYTEQNQYQNNTFKINKSTLKKQYRNAINTKIQNLFENKKKFHILNMKNIFNTSYKKDERYLPNSQSFVKKCSFNENNNNYININDVGFSDRNLFNDISDINLDDSDYNNDYKPKNFIENININNVRKKKVKKRNEHKNILDDLPQGSYDNYFINKFSVENTNKTSIYNITENLNKNDNKVKHDLKIDNYNNFEIINQKNNFESYNEIRDRKENINNNTSIKNNDNDYDNENNKDKLKNHFILNNSIINTINFTFNPIKVKLNKKANINLSNGNINKKNIISDNDIKINKSEIKNSREKLNNKQIQNNNINIENYINKYTSQKESKESKEIKDDNNDNNFNQNKNNEQKELEDKDTQNKENNSKIPFIDPDELAQETIILNKSIDILEENNDNDNDNNILNKKRKVKFDDKKIIIEYNQNDYIKKSYIFTNNNPKKTEHIFISTKEHIKNLKKENKKKSILKKEIKPDDDALLKLNELISEVFVDKNVKNKKNENGNEKSNKKEGKSDKKAPFIKKNINYIKKMQDNNKKGLKYKVESKSEIKLLKKKKKDLCVKFQNNPQNFYTIKLNDNIMKSFGFDDSDIMKLNIKKELSNIQKELSHKMNKSHSGELQIIKKFGLI